MRVGAVWVEGRRVVKDRESVLFMAQSSPVKWCQPDAEIQKEMLLRKETGRIKNETTLTVLTFVLVETQS